MNKSDSGSLAVSKEDQDMITLAVKCKFITAEQSEKLQVYYLSRLETQNDYTLLKAFDEFKLLSADEIEFLTAIRAHLSVKRMDLQFGKLAVANNFTTQDAVLDALDHQTSHFQKHREHLPLGDILVNNRKIKEKEKISILLTQDRIEDDLLGEAMNSLAAGELEKLSSSKRFGSIAVSMGYVTIDQVNQALRLQKEKTDETGKPRFLGQILEASFGLSPKATLKILKEQKKIEKKRLNLEAALSRYNEEIKTNQTLSRLFEYRVTEDKLEAFVRVAKPIDQEIFAHSLINWVRLMGVQYGFADTREIEAFLATAAPGVELKIASGTPPEPGKDAIVGFNFDPDQEIGATDKNDDVSAHPRQQIHKGDVLIRRLPHKPGTPGINVFNQAVDPPAVNTFDYKCGNGVIKDEQGNYVAVVDGQPVLFENHTLFVAQKEKTFDSVNFSGPVTAELDNAYQMLNLKVDGRIEKDSTLRCQSLDLRGDVVGNIDAGGDVAIHGSIGEDSGSSPPETFPLVRTQGNVNVSGKVANATIECGKYFHGTNADIVDARISARHGIFAKNVYSNEENPTVLRIGHAVTSKIDALDRQIREKTALLDELTQKFELQALEKQFYQQVQIQDEYRDRQNALAYLMKITGDLNLDNIDTLGPGFDFFTSPAPEDASGDNSYALPVKTRAYEYLEFVQDKIENDPPDIQIKRIQKFSEENYGMIKAAAAATEKMEKEFARSTEQINQAVENKKDQIDDLEKQVGELILEKEFLHLQDHLRSIAAPPEIKVKNQISKGTVVEGKNSKLVIDKTIYGVKLVEKKSRKTNQFQIEILGYFE